LHCRKPRPFWRTIPSQKLSVGPAKHVPLVHTSSSHVQTPSAHAFGRAAALAAVPAVVHVPAPTGQSAFDVHPTSSLPVHTRQGHSVPGGDVHGRFAPSSATPS
jgi:hypothetical protein